MEKEPHQLPRPSSLPDLRMPLDTTPRPSLITTLEPFRVPSSSQTEVLPGSDESPQNTPVGLGRHYGSPTADSLQSPALDTLMMTNVFSSLSYRAIHSTFKSFGTVTRIRLIYDDDSMSNRCYVTFTSCDSARLAYDAAASLALGGPHLTFKVIRSANVADSESDYIPNVFENAKDHAPKVRRVPTPYWFVGYYRDGQGNFLHAARYLETEVGVIPEGHLKKYGKGVLVHAKDLTQAMMLLHLPCPSDGIFESIKPHRTFNYCKGSVFNQDLFAFTEEDILGMCPDSVQRVSKIRGSTMIVLAFYGSYLPERVKIGPLRLKIRPFIDRPLQCYSCYGFGHGKKNCTDRPRCGRCSALDSHPSSECESDPYCCHCREAHPPSSRQCGRYRLEQDILHLANSQFISLGSARRELLFRQGKDGATKTYASSLDTRSSGSISKPGVGQSRSNRPVAVSSRPSNEAVSVVAPNNICSTSKTTTSEASNPNLPRNSPVSSCTSQAAVGTVELKNKFAALTCDSAESFTESAQDSSTLIKNIHKAAVHASNNYSPKKSVKTFNKRLRGSTESVDLSDVPPTKVSVGVHEHRKPEDNIENVVTKGRDNVVSTPSIPARVACPNSDVLHMETEVEEHTNSPLPHKTSILASGNKASSSRAGPVSNRRKFVFAEPDVSHRTRVRPSASTKSHSSQVPISLVSSTRLAQPSRFLKVSGHVDKGKTPPGASNKTLTR